MAFVHQQAAKLDEQTKAFGDQSVIIKEQSVTIEEQSKMIEQLRQENIVRITKGMPTLSISGSCSVKLVLIGMPCDA